MTAKAKARLFASLTDSTIECDRGGYIWFVRNGVKHMGWAESEIANMSEAQISPLAKKDLKRVLRVTR